MKKLTPWEKLAATLADHEIQIARIKREMKKLNSSVANKKKPAIGSKKGWPTLRHGISVPLRHAGLIGVQWLARITTNP